MPAPTTPEVKKEVLEQIAAGALISDIAKARGMATSTIYRIAKEFAYSVQREEVARALAIDSPHNPGNAVQHAFEAHIRSKIHGHRNS